MSRDASPGTNKFRCNACGRYFNAAEELRDHEKHCRAAKQSTRTGAEELAREDSAPHPPNDEETKEENYQHGTGKAGD